MVPPPLKMRYNMAWNVSGSLFKTFCNWLITIVAVRMASGFDVAGVLALAMSITNLVFPIAEYRLRTIHVTDVKGEHSSAQYLGLRLATSLLALGLGVVYTLATTDPMHFWVITIYVFGSLLSTYAEGYHAIEQRYERMDYIGISYILQGASNLALFMVGLHFFESLLVSVSLIALANALIVFGYDLPRAARFESIRPVFQPRMAALTLTKLAPAASVIVAFSFVTLWPRQHLEATLGTEALGIYASVAVPAVIIQATAAFMYQPLLGPLVTSFTNDRAQARRLMLKIAAFFVLLVVFTVTFFHFFGDPFLELIFGPDILAFSYLLQPAIALSILTAAVWFLNDLLLGLRDNWGCFVSGVVASVTTLATTSALTERFALNGPSAVGIVALCTTFLTLVIFLGRRQLHAGKVAR